MYIYVYMCIYIIYIVKALSMFTLSSCSIKVNLKS